LHETVVVQRKILVPVRIDQRKGGPHRTIHGGFAGAPASPSQIGAPDAGRKDKGLLCRHTDIPPHIRGIQHAVRLGVTHKRVHTGVMLFRTVLFDEEGLARFGLGSLCCFFGVLLLEAAVVALLSTHCDDCKQGEYQVDKK